MVRFAVAMIGAGLASSALAQTFPALPSAALQPVFLSLPVPPGGCVWAGRAFSEGAGFCFAPKVIIKCNSGKWSYDTLDACTNTAPIDTR